MMDFLQYILFFFAQSIYLQVQDYFVNMQPTLGTLSMKQLYNEVRHYTEVGIQGYAVAKKYEDPAALIRSRESATVKRKVKQLKRGNYLDDEAYVKKDIPGVCTYDILEKEKPRSKSRKNVQDKKTYLDEIMAQNKKDHVPGPNQYSVLQSMGSQLAGGSFSISKFSKDPVSERKKNIHKITYLDNAQFEGSQTPGVGEYLVERALRSKTQHTASLSKLDRKPEYWKQHHKQVEQKMTERLRTEVPGAGHYHPKIQSYELFEDKKKISRTESQIRLARLKPGRFRTEQKDEKEKKKKQDLGPAKYSILNQWAPKQKDKKGILSIISKAPPPSVYYH